jgi:glycosyltransferase involved in cell wall biosynthesis
MDRIGIFAPAVHEQYVHALLRIANTDDHHVTVFTSHEKVEQVQSLPAITPSDYEWIVRNAHESAGSFTDRMAHTSSELDSLLFVTLPGSLRGLSRYARTDFDCETFLYVYNLHGWLTSGVDFSEGLVQNLERWVRKKVLANIDSLVVEYPQLKSYAEEMFDPLDGQVHHFPPVVYEDDGEQRETDETVISVPGNIDQNRRDYDVLIDGLEQALTTLSSPVRVQLLGPPMEEYGSSVVQRCQSLRSEQCDVVTFEERLSSSEFEARMARSDLLISPLRYVMHPDQGQSEVFGITKGSGSVFDAIRHAVPAVFPHYFSLPHYARPSSQSFTDSEALAHVVTSFLEDREYRERLSEEAVNTARRFTLSEQRRRFEELLSNRPMPEKTRIVGV